MPIQFPARLVLETAPTFGAMLKAFAGSVIPLINSRKVPPLDEVREFKVAPPSAHLLDKYLAWSGAPADRYDGILPPHFCSHWAMGALATLGGLAPYDVRSILNQGLRLQIKAPIQRGESLLLRGQLLSINEEPSRVRIHTRIVARTAAQGEVMIIDNYTAIPRGGKSKKAASTRPDETLYKTIGHWSAGPNEGINFGLLTGDYNPIHTLWPVARRSKFGGCILQGFGTLARSFEVIRDAGFDIADIEVRFIKPLLLPCPMLEVQLAEAPDSKGAQHFRLRNQDGSIHLAGSFFAR
ncbi:MaoC like domain-containing protein [Pseudomonas pohangensis]|uniref:MaoC like domain-containing protein n=1 Tax=Pseudomonas pohangensis TaxID=364197 RepID=A0A1H2FBV7_9PSED|nr:MaoC/PaaZ C-terminal domain-containing protein [Pseudomonas pohangensis]SDU04448.1 MaoC like domain-containing protein [Pseudomonas pohangensis]